VARLPYVFTPQPAMKKSTESAIRKTLIGLACGVSGIGAYLCYWWPRQWQAGFVFVLFGMIVIIPVTVQEIRFRKRSERTFSDDTL
jgi:hypothetical protein